MAAEEEPATAAYFFVEACKTDEVDEADTPA